MEAGKRSGRRVWVLSAVLLAFVAALLVLTVILVRVKLLQNAQSLGMALAKSYAVEEENHLRALEAHLAMASHYVNEIEDGGGSPGQIREWLSGYFSKMTDIVGESIVDFYAVIDGQIVAANPREGDETFDYRLADWYNQAVEAEGEAVCGPSYLDAVTGQRIITFSQALERGGNVLAMDVYIQNPALHLTVQDMPEELSYYLCDQNGNLVYSAVRWNVGQDELQRYAGYLLAGIADGSLLAYDASFQDLDGYERGVYYYQMSNGWTAILTLPMSAILMGEENATVFLMAGVGLVLYLALVLLTVQDVLRSRRIKVAGDTAHMLGDSFYAIYRVNFRAGRYQTIKGHRSVNDLPPTGDYDTLLSSISAFVRPNTLQAFEASFSLDSIRQRIAQGIADYGGDYQRRFGETYRWVNIRTLYNREVDPSVVILCFRDVEEEKRRELQQTILLQEALEAAQKSTQAKSIFFSSMSHDMRTPLNAIIGCCDLARRSYRAGEREKVEDYLKKIAFAGDQLLALINDILELSRIEAGKNNLAQREMDLRALLVSLTDIFRDQAREQGKEMQVSIEFQEDRVVGDEGKITQIVNNLLSNAVKYTNSGGRVRLEARQFRFQQHSKYQILVEDTGIGMSAEFLEHLFDPYSRETTFSAHPVMGTGLGMPIVRSLVQQMSGEISVESQLGQGTRVMVTLPLQPAARQESGPGEAQDQEASLDWKELRILVAEDNELNREILTAILGQLGAQVLQAANGEEAVALFQDQPIFSVDAILMDMQMPRMDGCQAAAAIRRLKRADAGTVPIVAVTANAFAEDIDRTTAAGMDAHVSKPIDSALLRQTVEKLIRRRGAARGEKR